MSILDKLFGRPTRKKADIVWEAFLHRIGYRESSADMEIGTPLVGVEFLRELFVEGAMLHVPLVSWGIFNPNGPTWCSLTLVSPRNCDVPVQVIFFQMSNPFSDASIVFGWMRDETDVEEAINRIGGLFLENGKGWFFKSAPTFVATSLSAPSMQKPRLVADWIYSGLQSAGVTGLQTDANDIRKFWLRQWDRAKYESERAWKQIAGSDDADRQPQEPPEMMLRSHFNDWFDVVSDPDHVESEVKALMQGWIGATTYYVPELPSTDLEEGTTFHIMLMKLGTC